MAKPNKINSHPGTVLTSPRFFNNLQAVSRDLGNVNKAISYLLPSDSKNIVMHASVAPTDTCQPSKYS